MPDFEYRAVATSGAMAQGVKTAADEAALTESLRASGHLVLSVKPVGEGATRAKPAAGLFKPAPTRAIIFFTHELAMLLDSGVPLARGLSILAEAQEHEGFRFALERVLEELKGGKPLSECLAEHPRCFPPFYVNLVHAGEEGGVLSVVLNRLAEFQERAEQTKSDVVSALIYPALLAMAGFASLAALVFFVIPKFATVFQGMGVELPLAARLLMGGADVAVRYGWIAASVVAVFGAGIWFKLRDPQFQTAVARWRLRLPVLGPLLWKSDVARFARTLATLMQNGVPLVESIEIVSQVLRNKCLAERLSEAKADVKRGGSLTAALNSHDFLPPFAGHLLRIGEETGALATMLMRAADSFDGEVRLKIKRLVTLVEPCMILFMGVVVGGIVVSMLTAIFSVNQLSL